MNYTIIALVFVILMMLYMGYVYITNTTLTKGVVKLTQPEPEMSIIPWQKITNPGARTYHYEGWVYVKSLPTSESAFFSRGQFALTLNSARQLRVCVGDTINVNTNGVTHVDGNEKMTIINEFPLQKWVYIVVNVVNNKIIEAYLNGKLVQTKQMLDGKDVSIINARDPIRIGGTASVDGYLTKFKRDPNALNPDEAWKNYLAGNGLNTFTNWLAGYNASFSVYSSTEEIRKYTLL